MKKQVFEESPLPPHRAFVVQLREHSDVPRRRWAGRIEHVTSGQATHFQSLKELLAFVSRILASPARDPPNE
jgi:hypothetical protein